MADMREKILERRRSSATSESDVKSIQRTRIWKSKDHIVVPEHVLRDHEAATAAAAGDPEMAPLPEDEPATSSNSAADGAARETERRRRATVQPKMKESAAPSRPQRQSLPAQFAATSLTKEEVEAMLNDDVLMRTELERISLEGGQETTGRTAERPNIPGDDSADDGELIDLSSANASRDNN